MTIRLNPRWLVIPVLLFSLQFCRAQVEIPPTNSFNLGSTDAPESQLWDLTGNYDVNIDVVGPNGLSVPAQLSFSLIQSPSGKLSGGTGISGLVFSDDDNSAFAVATTVSGKVTGSDGFARARFTVHFMGNGSLSGKQNLTVRGSLTVDAEVDPLSGQLLGNRASKFTANILGVNKIKGEGDFAVALPPGVDGSWNLTLNIIGLNKLTGTGIMRMPSESFGLDLKGKLKGGLIDLNAAGAKDVPNTLSGVGSHANILITPTFDTLQLNGKLLGQKISFNVATQPPAQ